MSPLIAVLIADDLTGSLDSIAPFAALGMACVTAVSPDAIGPALALAPEVLSVNLGTREVRPDQARSRAALATRALNAAAGPGTFWIKKIDSRLKGPIAAEISGIAEVLPLDRLLLCPAIPELGRIVLKGQLQGEGVAGGLPVARTVALDLPCDVPDASSDADLDRLAATLRPGIPVAAARGLAAALARRLRPGHLPAPAHLQRGPLGFAVGSRDPVTLAQVAQLQRSGGPRFIPAPDGEVPNAAAPGPCLIQATAGAGAEGHVVTARLAAGVIRHIPGLRTLVLTGGETAAAVLDAVGIRLLRISGEVLPGLPLCHAEGLPGFPDLITKSGGFGPPDTLLRLWQAAQLPEGSP
jgi:D-threonate/D-erythronate kinase